MLIWRESLAAFSPASGEHALPALAFHTRAKAVVALAAASVRLIRAFHGCGLLIDSKFENKKCAAAQKQLLIISRLAGPRQPLYDFARVRAAFSPPVREAVRKRMATTCPMDRQAKRLRRDPAPTQDGGQAVNEPDSQKSGVFALKSYDMGLCAMFAAREKRLFTPVDKPVNSISACARMRRGQGLTQFGHLSSIFHMNQSPARIGARTRRSNDANSFPA
jgi:hypothetical protein